MKLEKDPAKIFLNRMEIAQRQADSASKKFPADSPLTAEEEQAYQILRADILKDSQSTEEFDRAVGAKGKKFFLHMFIMPVRVMGVPATWFVGTAFFSMLLFISTQSLDAILLAALPLHILLAVIYKLKYDDIYYNAIQKIITKGSL